MITKKRRKRDGELTRIIGIIAIKRFGEISPHKLRGMTGTLLSNKTKLL